MDEAAGVDHHRRGEVVELHLPLDDAADERVQAVGLRARRAAPPARCRGARRRRCRTSGASCSTPSAGTPPSTRSLWFSSSGMSSRRVLAEAQLDARDLLERRLDLRELVVGDRVVVPQGHAASTTGRCPRSRAIWSMMWSGVGPSPSYQRVRCCHQRREDERVVKARDALERPVEAQTTDRVDDRDQILFASGTVSHMGAYISGHGISHTPIFTTTPKLDCMNS